MEEVHETNGRAVADPTQGLKDLASYIVEELRSARMLDTLADLIARRINLQGLEPTLKAVALKLELEREYVRRDGLGRYARKYLTEKGIRLDIRRGRLHAGPSRLIDTETKALIIALRSELMREISIESEP
jgi:hypothetical protein